MKTLIKILLILASGAAYAQQSTIPLPTDSRNNPLIVGLGVPFLSELSITNTTYDDTNKITLPKTGKSLNRVFRHLALYNASTTLSVYLCYGATAAGCTLDMVKARPSLAFVDDFSYFGDAVGTPFIFYRIGSAGTASVDVRVW